MVERGAGSGPFFQFLDGQPLTRARFFTEVKESLMVAGIDCTAYSGHSFRSGAATTAVGQGISYATINMLGRWRSSAYQFHITPPGNNWLPTSILLVVLSSVFISWIPATKSRPVYQLIVGMWPRGGEIELLIRPWVGGMGRDFNSPCG